MGINRSKLVKSFLTIIFPLGGGGGRGGEVLMFSIFKKTLNHLKIKDMT